MNQENEIPIGPYVNETDKIFYTSPDCGHPDCLCSRCGKSIPEEESPILRMWLTEPGDHGFDPKAAGGTELRYCRVCCNAMGIIFGNPEDLETDDPNFHYDET